jgi:hypothetical protein
VGGACEDDEDEDKDVEDEGGAAHEHGDCVGDACEDDEDKDENVEDEGGEPSRPRLFRPLQSKKDTVNIVANYVIK